MMSFPVRPLATAADAADATTRSIFTSSVHRSKDLAGPGLFATAEEDEARKVIGEELDDISVDPDVEAGSLALVQMGNDAIANAFRSLSGANGGGYDADARALAVVPVAGDASALAVVPKSLPRKVMSDKIKQVRRHRSDVVLLPRRMRSHGQ
jgi:hypothetical protein